MWLLALKQSINSNNAVDAVHACIEALSEGYGFDVNEARHYLNIHQYNLNKERKMDGMHQVMELPPIRPCRSPKKDDEYFCAVCRSCIEEDNYYVDEERCELVCGNCRF